MTQIKTFKSPSKILFKVAAVDTTTPKLEDTKRGETFLLNGAVCMRADVSPFQAIKDIEAKIYNLVRDEFIAAIWVTNLQTGRTFVACGNQDIEYVKVTMTLVGVV